MARLAFVSGEMRRCMDVVKGQYGLDVHMFRFQKRLRKESHNGTFKPSRPSGRVSPGLSSVRVVGGDHTPGYSS
jgi:hypothetical protein